MPKTGETAAEERTCPPSAAGDDAASISAALLNEAMASLGLAGLRFEEVDGKPVLRRYCDELSLDRFIGLLLMTIVAVHRQRQAAVDRLGKLDETIRHLAARGSDGEPGVALTAEAAALMSELRRLLSEPVLEGAAEPLAMRLTIGCEA